jgi:hypothetical protein
MFDTSEFHHQSKLKVFTKSIIEIFHNHYFVPYQEIARILRHPFCGYCAAFLKNDCKIDALPF